MIYVFIFITGVCLGSFYACIGYRIPNKISIVKPSSFCPNCKNSLKWYMNIPLLSYIFLKGKCAYCKEKISITYFLIELTTGILFFNKLHNIWIKLSINSSINPNKCLNGNVSNRLKILLHFR